MVTASDEVAADALTAVAEAGSAEVFPTARCARLTADREGLRRLAADELGLPTAPFWFAGSLDELRAVATHAGYPLRVQPLAAVGGEGQSVVLLPADLEPGLAARGVCGWPAGAQPGVGRDSGRDRLPRHPAHCVRRWAGRARRPSSAHRSAMAKRSDVQESWQPQDLSVAAQAAAKSISARVVKALGGRGVFGVELMVRGDEVYFSDATARPFESGLVTVRTQRLSEFELHARAILGLPTDTIMISPGAAEARSTPATTVPVPRSAKSGGVLTDALRVPESDVRVFAGHGPTRGTLGVARQHCLGRHHRAQPRPGGLGGVTKALVIRTIRRAHSDRHPDPTRRVAGG